MMTQPQNQNQRFDQPSNLIWGGLLILAGLLFLLSNLGVLGVLQAFVWVALFSAGGLFFLYLFLQERTHRWWAAIPGSTLLGLAATIFFSEIGPRFLQPLAGSIFLASIGLGFALVYLAVPANWWALIPAGVMTTLAVVAGVDSIGPRWFDSGGIFFVGLGLTFLLVALLPNQAQNLRWALIPGGVLLLMGLLIGTPLINLFGSLWPLALIAAGLFLVWRRLNGKDQGEPPAQEQ
jgi:hypothetical protein